MDAPKRHKQRQLALRQIADDAWQEEDLVFTNAFGHALRGNHILERHFAPILRRVCLPPLRFHDLRHTAATLLWLQGIHPKIVAEMLGHSTVSMSLDTYSHVLPDMHRDASAAFDRLLGDDNRPRD